jgi:hypothetical protein
VGQKTPRSRVFYEMSPSTMLQLSGQEWATPCHMQYSPCQLGVIGGQKGEGGVLHPGKLRYSHIGEGILHCGKLSNSNS